MKPLIYLLSIALMFAAANVFASCTPDSCKHYREHRVKVNYKEPVIYCNYADDARGVQYTICRDCNKNGCLKEYFFSNYCDHDQDC